jgi:hypothetical protein
LLFPTYLLYGVSIERTLAAISDATVNLSMKVKNAAQVLLESSDDITNDEIDSILGLSGIDDGLREVSRTLVFLSIF